jgi:hypothetical protein
MGAALTVVPLSCSDSMNKNVEKKGESGNLSCEDQDGRLANMCYVLSTHSQPQLRSYIKHTQGYRQNKHFKNL